MSDPASNVPVVSLTAELPFEQTAQLPLAHVTFVVVDLETTGGSSATEAITEIGAVKVRGGEVLGEFATLVDPERGLRPFITVLTGITESMLVGAPPAGEAVSSFLAWAKGCVLVAHNAPFDVGFLRAATTRAGLSWPGFEVLDTARIARRALTRDEAPSCKLSALAALFRSPVSPVHRALADAQATVHVLHGLIGRVGNLGVGTVSELKEFSADVPPQVRRKRHLADRLPHGPGVYLFRDGRGRVLYVGTSRDLRTRVRSYYTSTMRRPRIAEMVRLAERIDAVVCATALEAEVREIRLIASEAPPYNRRSKFPARASWLTLTREPYPRLVLSRSPDGEGPWLGPFGSRRSVELARTAIHDAVALRQCSGRLPVRASGHACALAEIGRCGAPCEGRETVADYAEHVAAARAAMAVDPSPVIDVALQRVTRLAGALRFEEAASQRDRVRAFARAAASAQALASLVAIDELVAARRTDDLGWELHAVRRGRLVGAAIAPRGAHPQPFIDAMLATAEAPPAGGGPAPAGLPEETGIVARWLRRDGVRLVATSKPWASPAHGAEGLGSWLS